MQEAPRNKMAGGAAQTALVCACDCGETVTVPVGGSGQCLACRRKYRWQDMEKGKPRRASARSVNQ